MRRCFTWLALPALLMPGELGAQGKVDSTSYPPRASYQHTLVIRAPYDADQGKTVLQTAPFRIDSTVALSVLTALDGRRVTTPATSIVFTFWSTGTTGRYAANHTVQVVLDGKDTLNLGSAWISPQHKPEYNDVLLKGLSLGQFLSIANATSVTVRLGSTNCVLSTSQIEGLRDFASRMAPEPH